MILDADVLKLNCKFVSETVKFITNRSYIAEPDIACLYPYFKYVGLADIQDCLTYDESCEVTNYTSTLTSPIPCDVVVTPCNVQGAITLTSLTSNCTYTTSPYEPTSGTVYPKLITSDNATYYSATINVKETNTCNATNTADYVVGGGYTSSGFSTSNYGSYKLFSRSNTGSAPVGSYFTTIRVYETDTLGAFVNTPIDLDLDPASSPYYSDNVDCPGCTAITSTHVQFGNANFYTAMATLMDNVSKARYGSTGKHNMYFNWAPADSTIHVGCTPKHNPSGNHFGPKTADQSFTWEKSTTGERVTKTRSSYNGSIQYPIRFYKDDMVFTTPCGTIEPTIANQTFYAKLNDVETDFYRYSFANQYAMEVTLTSNKALTLSGTTSSTCESYTLNASFSGTGVSSIEWQDSDQVTLSTTDYTITVSNPGVYTFIVTLEGGCVIMKSINTETGVSIDVSVF